ncbi:mycofactocin-coupled SDR family oxidoreductase [Rhodococcoides yunnanense]|uniref:mycofactocin-coupled SDR family oxidoreductase n=1 Tax=Rhodococcoides yunnanense TaxID=278209 RepID=UPI00093283B3|nr:mycofactocin-coupled SDR family oxidoreductase [Rhodococcus yunnanensis]
MGRFDGKVALVTGAARGQGRSHAVRLAAEGAAIVAVDLCRDVSTTDYALGTEEDLAETARAVEAEGGRILTKVGDTRVQTDLDSAVAAGLSRFGSVDIAVANAGIVSWAPVHEISDAQWTEMIDINLTGTWRTIKAVVPAMLERKSGSIVIVNSGAGLSGPNNLAHYAAAKHGLVGLMRSASNELSPEGIRVNSVHPSQVDTPMIMHDSLFGLFRPDLEKPTKDDIVGVSQRLHTIPVPWVEPVDVSHAVLFLASDDARYITGTSLPVDAGGSIKTSY